MGNFTVGLDLAKERDYTALAVVERLEISTGWHPSHYGEFRETFEDSFECRHLERLPLGTPYTAVVAHVCELMDRPPLKYETELVFDKTGIGSSVSDLFSEAYFERRLAHRPFGVTITSGEEARGGHVPKKDLVSNLITLREKKKLTFARGMPFLEELDKEIRSFSVKLTARGNVTFEGKGRHDDLVIALALACLFRHGKGMPRLLEGNPTGQIQLEMRQWYPIDLWSRD
jgi:hypothetical protein